jgi:hypothetical protein
MEVRKAKAPDVFIPTVVPPEAERFPSPWRGQVEEFTRVSEQRLRERDPALAAAFDELEMLGYVERRPDPSDRRAKLICPTGRALAQMRAADHIMVAMQERHAERVGKGEYTRFKRVLVDITEHQRLAGRSARD